MEGGHVMNSNKLTGVESGERDTEDTLLLRVVAHTKPVMLFCCWAHSSVLQGKDFLFSLFLLLTFMRQLESSEILYKPFTLQP